MYWKSNVIPGKVGVQLPSGVAGRKSPHARAPPACVSATICVSPDLGQFPRLPFLQGRKCGPQLPRPSRLPACPRWRVKTGSLRNELFTLRGGL